MNWNCPHCHTHLNVQAHQVTSAWQFSLCPTCKRFGLVRKENSEAVKVDRPPVEERFIRAVKAGATNKEITPPPFIQKHLLSNPKNITSAVSALPPPLPEIAERRKSLLPRLVLFGCGLILVWNGFRYQQLKVPTSNESASLEITDRVASKAMAPSRIELRSSVRSRAEGIKIHNGPGVQYPVIGVLNPSESYKVVASDENWYQLQLEIPSAAWVIGEDLSPAN